MFQDHSSLSPVVGPGVRTSYVPAYLGWKPSLLPPEGKRASGFGSRQLDRRCCRRPAGATGSRPVAIPRARSSWVGPVGGGIAPSGCKGNYAMNVKTMLSYCLMKVTGRRS